MAQTLLSFRSNQDRGERAGTCSASAKWNRKHHHHNMDDWFYKGLIQGLKDKKVNLNRGTNQRSVPHLRAVVSRIEPGFYAGVISSPSELDVTLQVLEGSEVSHEITYQSSGVGFSTGERVRAGASHAGYVAAEYIDSQIKSK